ncbi:MAG: hypothetical protein QXO71_07285 [Candidatus Jordarchaeaceae archaeon]
MNIELEKEVERKKEEIIRNLLKWGKENIRSFPWRKKRTPYAVLLAEVLLRRTTAKAVCRIYEPLIEKYPNVYSLSHAEVKDLEKMLSVVGYNKQRALILKEMAKFIISEYGGKIPNKKEELMNIPHIGNYIAGAILSLGYGIPSAMVDSNVQRIIGRVFSRTLPTKGKRKAIVEVAEAIVPGKNHELFNFAMLDLGALICKYNEKICQKCPLSTICDSAA